MSFPLTQSTTSNERKRISHNIQESLFGHSVNDLRITGCCLTLGPIETTKIDLIVFHESRQYNESVDKVQIIEWCMTTLQEKQNITTLPEHYQITFETRYSIAIFD